MPVLMIWRWLHCLAVESGTFPAGAVSRARWHFVHGSAKALRVFSHTQPIARVPQLSPRSKVALLVVDFDRQVSGTTGLLLH